MKKIINKILLVFADIIIAGVILCIFALFHHVIPQKGNVDDAIIIARPTTSDSGFQLPQFGALPTIAPNYGQTEEASPQETNLHTNAHTHIHNSTQSNAINTATPVATVTPVATATSVPNVTPSIEPTAVPTSTASQAQIIQTDNMYRSENILVNMQTVQVGSGSSKVTYHVADIYITDIECLKTAFAEDTYGENFTQSVLEQDKQNKAIVAISGDSYGLTDTEIVLRNGILYEYSRTSSDICVLYYDGTMETLSPGEYTKESLIEKGAYQVWNFGPGLLDENGKAKTSFNAGKYITKAHPRASIGYYDPGHYAFVLVDGRQEGYSNGLDIEDLAKLYEDLGCKAAYNLDGGISAVMTFNDKIYSHPERTREVSDIIYIGEI